MSLAGPGIWRTFSVGLASCSRCRSILHDLAPLRQWARPNQLGSGKPQRSISRIAPKLQYSRFSTATRCFVENGASETSRLSGAENSNKILSLSRTETQKIFSDLGAAKRGQEILETLQDQRATGTLDEGLPEESDRTVTEGIQWLRQNIPCDEDAAIEARLDREDEEEWTKLSARAEELGLIKPSVTSDHTIQEPLPRDGAQPLVYVPQQDGAGRGQISKSFVEELREKNEKRRQTEVEAKLKAEEEAKTNGVKTGLPAAIQERRLAREKEREIRFRKNMQWKERKMEEAQNLYGKPGSEAPDLAPWQRLWPSALMTLGVVGLSLGFAQIYAPPPPEGRVWPEVSPATATIGVLIAVNVLVYLGWFVVPFQKAMYERFIVVPGYPRAIAIIANIFSHQEGRHLLVNMFGLFLFGTRRTLAPSRLWIPLLTMVF